MRTFLAVPLPERLQRQLAREAGRLRPLLPGVRWVRAGTVHLTLLFLGEVAAERIPALEGLAGPACAAVPADRLPVRGMGCFPERGPVRVLWVGVEDVRGTLTRLRDALGQCARSLQLPGPEGVLRPHLTLGRARRGLRRAQVQPFLDAAGAFDDLPVEQCVLFRSTLGPGGARHDPLQRFALGADA